MSDQVVLNYTESQSRFADFIAFYERKSIDSAALEFDVSKSITENLNILSVKALKPELSTALLYSLEPIYLDFISRWISNQTIELEYAKSNSIHNNTINDQNDIFAQVEEKLDAIVASQEELQMILVAFFRLLQQDQDRFMKFVSPDTISKILGSSNSAINKYLAVLILAQYLSFSEKAQNDMLNNFLKSEESLVGSLEGDSNIDFRFLGVLEAKRLANYQKLSSQLTNHEAGKTDSMITIENSMLSKYVISVCGVLVPKVHFDQPLTTSTSFIATDRSVSTLRTLATHIQHSSPVMLIGGAGSGKTFLINELSKYLSCDKTLVKIHLGEQTDAKLLLGTYTSGSKPGTFEWRHGVLTTAVMEGRWVLIEDIDKAPTEVLSVLLSLLEKRELTIPSRGEVIKAANGFQLISTIRTSAEKSKKGKKGVVSIPDLIGLRLWRTLHIEDPSKDELTQILSSQYPVLERLIPSFIQLFEAIQQTYTNKSFLVLNKGSHPRVISARDLIKFCQRVNVIFNNSGISSSSQLLESSVLDNIFAEAVDCFASAISEAGALEPLINVIGSTLQIASSRIQLFLKKHVPAYDDLEDKVVIGRAHLNKASSSLYKKKTTGNKTSFARTNHSLRLMEQIGVAIQMTEPVLLVGETGTGKTTVVQQVAKQLNKELTVINVSQQTETGDLLGGYKPVNAKAVAVPLQESFLDLFRLTFSAKKNEKFEKMLIKCFNRSQWKNVVKLWTEAVKLANQVFEKSAAEEEQQTNVGEDGQECAKKKRKLTAHDRQVLKQKWDEMETQIKNFEAQSHALENSFVFNFVEGSLVKAVRNGDWLLLDEINLASPDTLESISDLLAEATQRSILLSEKGEVESIQAHPDFRIFACMNPATDVGKRDLPLSIRSRFTEIYVHSPDGDIADLLQIIDRYVGRYALSDEWVGNDIAQLYLEAKRLAESNQIVDGANQKPHFSIRTLTRTLLYVCDIVSIYGLRRSLYEGFSMAFLTLLDKASEEILQPLIRQHTIGRLKNAKSVISQIPPNPSTNDELYVQFKHYWMRQGPEQVIDQPHYIITPFVEKNMLNLVRATSGKKFPILIQGPTSSGKTSMVKYLADITGNKFVRINNHEHTDLQEYLGTYISDDTGKLTFKEGILVEALRKGHWLVLDELNLAPTDVLEALNRLLDDNRELFIPETQEVVHPHPDFMLFATQNPPGLYGGRKVLSRAFRNRFLELHFDDIPQDELEIILRERCQIAPTYAKKIVEVYRQLTVQRQSSRLFEQKNSFATLRDLFRWALREAVGYEQLAANGYMLLAERVRKPEEKVVVKEVLEKVMKVKLDMDAYYQSLENEDLMKVESSVVWTKAIRRLAVLIQTSLNNNEPILLVGETGCGKTTVCQLLAEFHQKKLITVNAHQNTETGDLLGAQRPVRNKSEVQSKLVEKLHLALTELAVEFDESSELDELIKLYDSSNYGSLSEEVQGSISDLRSNMNVLFEWTDGPLIQALTSGQYFLLDEISLADDSVLERLNSVLEPERSLLLAEKGTSEQDAFITASQGFQFLSTMNPGGDYGKKELSPALRNRFTEIWVPSMEDFNDVQTIVESRLAAELKHLAPIVVKFSESFAARLGGGAANISSGVISLRDILAWVEFINSSYASNGDVNGSLLHGASMVFIDALGTNNTAYLAESEERLNQKKMECVQELSEIAQVDLTCYYSGKVSVSLNEAALTAGLFSIPITSSVDSQESFSFQAPTTAANAMRVIRAMQVHKPILLEGSPGVGKTSLVSALAKATGNPLTRINLSEQTDLVDLFGSDAPVEGGKTGEFTWRDAPFLRAMKQGEWVLLDEMNLASQSVLEGLNACLDHRGEAYIPELDKSFPRHPNFLVFAAQNPQYQGGGRKGLPKSFVNRFSVVYVDMLSAEDLVMIASHLHPNIDSEVCAKMIQVVSQLEDAVTVKKIWGSNGAPWEFNLRDTLRWLDLYDAEYVSQGLTPVDFMNIIITQRFRSVEDRLQARKIIDEVFESTKPLSDSVFNIGENFIQSKKAIVARSQDLELSPNHNLNHLQTNVDVVESCFLALANNWPLILTGPSNSGKTDLVRYLSSVTGSKIVEFSMNSDIDSMDILGGYEQLDLTREITAVLGLLEVQLKLSLVRYFQSHGEVLDANVQCLTLLKYLNGTHITLSNFAEFMVKFEQFFSSIYEDAAVTALSVRLHAVQTKIQETANSVRFEWFDGLLVKAVEEGHWLVLDNANLCSPSVLDRLNSLLEINGSLIMNECSLPDGSPRILKPHPNFRLFMTVDPKFGELSRAMRNRGVEIFMEDLEVRSTQFDRLVLSEGSVSKFISCDDSNGFQLAQILDTASSADSQDITFNQKLTSVLATSVPFIAQPQIGQLAQTIAASAEFSARDHSLFQQLNQSIADLSGFEVSKALLDLYQLPSTRADGLVTAAGGKLNLDVHQSLNPLWNVYIQSTLTGSESVGSSLTHFFDLISTIAKGLTQLSEIETRAIHGKVSDLTYLEQGAALSNGRNIRGAPKLNVFSLLKQTLEYLLSQVKSFSVEEVLQSVGVFESLHSLVNLWTSLFETTKVKDEAKVRVFQKLMNKWVKDTKSTEIDTAALAKILDQFDQDLKLTRGELMTPIWEKFRGSYPDSAEAWNQRDELMKLIKKFDTVSFKQYSNSDDLIAGLSTSILGLYDQVSNSESNSDVYKSAFGALESGIQALESASAKFLIQRSHNFQENFAHLFNFVVSASDAGFNNDILKLAQYAGLGTSALLDFESMVYPRVFETLWSKEKSNGGFSFSSSTASLFSAKFLENVLSNVGNYNNFSGDQLDQTVSDSLVFTKNLIRHSGAVTKDMLAEHKKVIINWYVKVFGLVCPSEDVSFLIEELSEDTLERLAVMEVESEAFNRVNASFFLPALYQLSNLNINEELGQAWILFSLGLIQLYVPDSAYDPAIEDHVLYENYQLKKSLCLALGSAFKQIREVKFGDDEIILEGSVPMLNDVDVPSKPRVFRQAKVSIHNLFEEWQSFMSSTVDLSAVTRFLESSEDAELAELTKHCELFQQNTSSFVERLTRQFSHFSDVNDIFKGYIFGLKLGFDLILQSRREFNAKYPMSPLWFVDLSALSQPQSFDKGFDSLREFTKSVDVDSAISEQIMRFLFNAVVSGGSHSVDSDDKLQQIFQTLYYRWSLRRSRQEAKAAEEGSLYRHTDTTEESDEEFKEMFPDFEDFLDISKEDGVIVKPTSELLKEEYAKFAQRFVSFMLKDEVLSSADLVHEGSEISKVLINHNNSEFIHGVIKPAQLSSIIVELSQSIDSASASIRSTELDFYRGYSPLELKRSVTIVTKLLSTVSELLAQWPEHATLQTLKRISLEYLAYPVKTPLARLIQKVEQIYTFVAEWEKYASSQVTLKSVFDEFTNLIVSWRRLELSTWKTLFDREDATNESSIGEWWFNLFEVIIVPLLTDEDEAEYDIGQIIGSLNLFISNSTYGQFHPRLRLLQSFSVYVNKVHQKAHSEIANTLSNLITFYSQFTPLIDQHINQGKKKLQKDISEVILLASWKDVNIDALKQSSRRSHAALYKIVRKYRTLLSGLIQPLIESGLTSSNKIVSGDVSIVGKKMAYVDIEAALTKVQTSVPEWESRPAHLKNIATINKNMAIYTTRITTASQDYQVLLDLAKDTLSEMDRLRKETPSKYTEENKKQITALKTQKRKLLTDTMKELKRIGLKWNMKQDIHGLQTSTALILSQAPSFQTLDKAGSSIDAHFFRIVELLPRLRAAVSEGNEEIPPRDIERGLAIVEDLMSYLIRGRTPIVKLSDGLDQLESLVEDYSKIVGDSEASSVVEFVPLATVADELVRAKFVLRWLPEILNHSINTVSIANKLGSLNIDPGLFDDIRFRLSAFGSILDKNWDASVLVKTTLNELNQYVSEVVVKDLTNWCVVNPTVKFIGQLVINWIGDLPTDAADMAIDHDAATSEVITVEEKLRKLSNQILITFQKITKLQSSFQTVVDKEADASDAEDDDLWFKTKQKQLSQLASQLRHKTVVATLSDLFSTLRSNKFNSPQSSAIKTLLTLTTPFLANYIQLSRHVLTLLLANHKDVSHSTYILSQSLLTLSKEGFCSPQEEDSEQKQDDNLQDGTGLGDGDGATNNSKDVEQDEELTEDAQEPNKEENKDEDKDEDDNDDAVEMEGDMAGTNENLSDQENSDDEDIDSEEEELDEEIDDLDDSDPNAIDDKMWDEEVSEENSKEKESDNMPDQNQKKDEDVTAMEDDEQQSKDKSKEDSKQDDQQAEDQPEQEDEDGQEEDEEDEDEGAAEQDDQVRNEDEAEQLDPQVQEQEALELPDDINLDGDEEDDDEKEGDEEEEKPDGLDDAMDDKFNEDPEGEEEQDAKMEQDDTAEQEGGEEEEDANAEEEDESMEPQSNETNEVDEDAETNEDEAMEVDEEGDAEDEELKEGDKEAEDDKDEGGDDQADDADENGDQMEGLEGADTGANEDEVDKDTAVEQQSGDQGDGAQADTNEEKEDVGATGSAQQQQQDSKDNEDQSSDPAQEEIKQSLKQLGDSLKQFHRRHQEIQEASSRDETQPQENSANERPDEFEHIDGANSNDRDETQALGAADKDQVSSINEDLAIDDDLEDEDEQAKLPEIKEEEEDGENVDDENLEEQEDSGEKADEFNGKTQGGIIGERKEDEDREDEDEDMIKGEIEEEQEDESDSDVDMDDEDSVAAAALAELNIRDLDDSRALWRESTTSTSDLTSSLCEQLRLILAPTLTTKLKGDYKTGKRLNMKRIIPYIASDFRKDKIWLRRTKPSKRQYQIMIAVDDSKSMNEGDGRCVDLAFQSISLVANALTQLESGELSIVKFGEMMEVVHQFGQQFTAESGAKVFQKFMFDQTRTNIHNLVSKSLELFTQARATSSGSAELWQLQIIISDGLCESHETIQRLVREAREKKIMLVFVIIDGINNANSKSGAPAESILDMSQVSYVPDANGNMALKVDKYLDSFPFEFYVVVKDIVELPKMLALILRQYFQESSSNV
ncbi:hypothetical protein WICPIJ_003141 [Wickerhamomyces pijperi]|uniref:Midasin n=1 Tax=Wickerhamomyces pijperi TaxID=599730 RepID=A0A9P8Q7T5_WICPI|nr:hypothetical protein WICPIJ_003141 [Wickerhamomyces pijperi]